jgi:fucose permease
MWLGRVVAATVSHRVQPPAILTGSAVAIALGCLGGAFLPWNAAALASCVATGFAVGGLWPTMFGLAAHRIPRGGATMFGLLALGGNCGCLFAPWAVGSLADHAGLRFALAWVAAAPVALLAILAALRAAETDARKTS